MPRQIGEDLPTSRDPFNAAGGLGLDIAGGSPVPKAIRTKFARILLILLDLMSQRETIEFLSLACYDSGEDKANRRWQTNLTLSLS